MTPQEAAPYRRQLSKMRAALAAQMDTPDSAEDDAAYVERSDDSSAQLAAEREFESSFDEREGAELAMIDAALARIEAGTYGECADCRQDIAAPRLQASPESPRCIACQQKAERRGAA
ncbi:MAG: transcriptional regulator, TraR/DksA family [Polaromonas sp.]|nr:transcriptional regulator, TraR/DksA family [Polaromonas sp.]